MSPMAERLSQVQIDTVKRVSKKMEEAWRVYAHPHEYSLEKVRETMSFLDSQIGLFKTVESLMGESLDIEFMEEVFVGLYHYPGFSLPPELKYKPNDRRN